MWFNLRKLLDYRASEGAKYWGGQGKKQTTTKKGLQRTSHSYQRSQVISPYFLFYFFVIRLSGRSRDTTPMFTHIMLYKLLGQPRAGRPCRPASDVHAWLYVHHEVLPAMTDLDWFHLHNFTSVFVHDKVLLTMITLDPSVHYSGAHK